MLEEATVVQSQEDKLMSAPVTHLINADDQLERTNLITGESTPIGEAFERMAQYHGGAVRIFDFKGIGLLSERHIISSVIPERLPRDLPVRRVMTENPKTLPLDSTVGDVVQQMHMHHIRHVLLDGKLPDTYYPPILVPRDVIRHFAHDYMAVLHMEDTHVGEQWGNTDGGE